MSRAATFSSFWKRHLPTSILAASLVALMVLGGSQRSDAASLIILRPLLTLALAALVLLPGQWRIESLAPLFCLLCAMAVAIAIQLVPLPPSWWTALPGQDRFAAIYQAAAMPLPWRPVSVTPDLTINSVLALLPALVILVSVARMDRDAEAYLLPLIILIAIFSAVWGILQIGAGRDSALYFYGNDDDALPIGFLANRNHQALLLAAMLPVTIAWGVDQTRRRLGGGALWVGLSLAIVIFFIMTIVTTGSRSGLLLALVAGYFAVALVPRPAALGRGGQRLLRGALLSLPLVAIAVTWFAGRAVSIARFVEFGGLSAEQRATTRPIVLQIIRDFLPFGSGFGSFDPVFRMYEPDGMLSPTYFNHAHNDLFELAMTGGVFALLLAGAFLWWLSRASWRAWRNRDPEPRSARFALASAAAIVTMLLGSLTDYPLRTPLIDALFAILACVLARTSSRNPDERLAQGNLQSSRRHISRHTTPRTAKPEYRGLS